MAGALVAQAPSNMPKADPLWPGAAPGAQGTQEEDQPTLAPYIVPQGQGTGTAVIVCPGGGYAHLSMDKEGDQVARWLNSIGVTAFVLKYRLGPKYHHPVELGDAQRAIRTVRYKAAELRVLPDRIGIMGFSAGGHLASTAGTHFDAGNASAADPIDRVSSRPDFLVLCYPVVTFGQFAHRGSVQMLLGDNPDPKLVENLSNELQVTPRTPPTFLFHTTSDSTVPVETASSSTWRCAKPESRPRCTSTSAVRMAWASLRRTRCFPRGWRAWRTGCACAACSTRRRNRAHSSRRARYRLDDVSVGPVDRDFDFI